MRRLHRRRFRFNAKRFREIARFVAPEIARQQGDDARRRFAIRWQLHAPNERLGTAAIRDDDLMGGSIERNVETALRPRGSRIVRSHRLALQFAPDGGAEGRLVELRRVRRDRDDDDAIRFGRLRADGARKRERTEENAGGKAKGDEPHGR